MDPSFIAEQRKYLRASFRVDVNVRNVSDDFTVEALKVEMRFRDPFSKNDVIKVVFVQVTGTCGTTGWNI